MESARFGRIEVPENQVITLPMGLPGFPEAETFVLIDGHGNTPFRWLQAFERPDLALIVIDPLDVAPDFPLDLVRRSASFAGIDPDEDLVVLVVCTVSQTEEPTANFLSPIGIGKTSRRGAQVVVHEPGFGSQERFLHLLTRG